MQSPPGQNSSETPPHLSQRPSQSLSFVRKSANYLGSTMFVVSVGDNPLENRRRMSWQLLLQKLRRPFVPVLPDAPIRCITSIMSYSSLKFAEALPPQCPNGNATRADHKGFWRFVMVKYPADDSALDDRAFSSQHGRELPCPPGKDPCDWASCSMFSEERAKKMALIPPFKNKPAVCLDVTQAAGPSRLDQDGHLHLWRVDGHDITQNIVARVEKL